MHQWYLWGPKFNLWNNQETLTALAEQGLSTIKPEQDSKKLTNKVNITD